MHRRTSGFAVMVSVGLACGLMAQTSQPASQPQGGQSPKEASQPEQAKQGRPQASAETPASQPIKLPPVPDWVTQEPQFKDLPIELNSELHDALRLHFRRLCTGAVAKVSGLSFDGPLRLRVRTEDNWFEFCKRYFEGKQDVYGRTAKTFWILRSEDLVVEFNPAALHHFLKDWDQHRQEPDRRLLMEIHSLAWFSPVVAAQIQIGMSKELRDRWKIKSSGFLRPIHAKLPHACATLVAEHALRQLRPKHSSKAWRRALMRSQEVPSGATEMAERYLLGVAGKANPKGWIAELQKPLPDFAALQRGVSKGIRIQQGRE